MTKQDYKSTSIEWHLFMLGCLCLVRLHKEKKFSISMILWCCCPYDDNKKQLGWQWQWWNIKRDMVGEETRGEELIDWLKEKNIYVSGKWGDRMDWLRQRV